jgi:hypothetical protein
VDAVVVTMFNGNAYPAAELNNVLFQHVLPRESVRTRTTRP